MQLILETENANINLSEKMSALEQQTLCEKPLQNGDNEDVVDEANKESENDYSCDKESGQIKENVVSNSEKTDNQNEDITADKPTESSIAEKENTQENGKDKDKMINLEADESNKKEYEPKIQKLVKDPTESISASSPKQDLISESKEPSSQIPELNEDIRTNNEELIEKKTNTTVECVENDNLQKQVSTENAELTKPSANSQAMDVDNRETSIEDPPEALESEVTQSISNIAAQISQNFVDDENEDSMDNIESESQKEIMEIQNQDKNVEKIAELAEKVAPNFKEEQSKQTSIHEFETSINKNNSTLIVTGMKEVTETSHEILDRVDGKKITQFDIPNQTDEGNLKENATEEVTEVSRDTLTRVAGKETIGIEDITKMDNLSTSKLNGDSKLEESENKHELKTVSSESECAADKNIDKNENVSIAGEKFRQDQGKDIAMETDNETIEITCNDSTSNKIEDADASIEDNEADINTIENVSIEKSGQDQKEDIAMESDHETIEIKSNDSSLNKIEDTNASIENIEGDINTIQSNVITKDTDLSEIQDEVRKEPGPESKDNTSSGIEIRRTEQQDDNEKTPTKNSAAAEKIIPLIKLSNTMDILSDEEDELSKQDTPQGNAKETVAEPTEKQCINLDDDDDIMLIDDDTPKVDSKVDKKEDEVKETTDKVEDSKSVIEDEAKVENEPKDQVEQIAPDTLEKQQNDTSTPNSEVKIDEPSPSEKDMPLETVSEIPQKPKPLIPEDFFKTYRKNLADMTRDELEEFTILKIVESVIDRSSLNEIRSKLKTFGQAIEEYKKKVMSLTKQNRDLQLVLKSVQEEQKKGSGNTTITPLKITRSVGMQVLMTDRNRRRVAGNAIAASNNTNQANNKNARTPVQSPRNTPQKPVNNQSIPVPRLVPAGINTANKASNQNTLVQKATVVQNGIKNTPPATKVPEKRTHSRMQSTSSSSVTVDLTDDEPPAKVAPKNAPVPPVRLVNPQNLLAPRQQFSQQVNSPRKVYIPISINGQQQPSTVRSGQTIMLKTVSAAGPRPRGPAPPLVRAPQNVPIRRVGARHPAPLPDAMKQYQPPNWKALPPAPDLKLSKVENGIVISWKIEGYQEDSYEEIASYQLYAYQETSAPPSTTLWKKIGDVKALPLPMACTLTQFMAGYKYYFAVRAVDIRSRLGPFSLPGSILLLNKM